TKELDIDSHTLYDLAQSLKPKGYDIRVVDIEESKVLILASGDNFGDDAISIDKVNKQFKIGAISEVRMGAKQSQISLLHWGYKEIFEKKDVDCVFAVGGLVIGKPTRTLLPDALITDPDELVAYVVKNFPRSDKFKTHIISGKNELSWGKTKDGLDVISAICKARDDLKKVAGADEGELEKNFNVKGVTIKAAAHFEDNSPKSVSNGPQNIANRLTKDNKSKNSPLPDILLVGGTHRRSFFFYNGMYIVTLASLHTQMRRQVARKVSVYVGCAILELNYNPDWTINLGGGGLKVHHFRLDDYTVKNDCYAVDLSKAKNLNEEGRQVLEWLSREFVINAGDIARRLKKSKETVAEIIKKLVACGYEIQLGEATKAYEFKMDWRSKQFSPLPLKSEDVFVWATKEAGISDPHLGSKEDLPEILKMAY
ncbi:MAG: helix-turn-helix domain-containing protein, partial [Nanoarchaeota archaeon]